MLVLGDLIERNAWRYPGKTATVFENTRYTFKEFSERVYRLGNALFDLGLNKGDAVAYLLPHNMMEVQEIIFGTTSVGMVVVPINSRFLTEEIVYLIKKCDVRALIFEKAYLDLVKSVRLELKEVKNFVCIGGTPNEGIINYETLLLQHSPIQPNVEVDTEDIAALIHTSGTTGKPKEAIWTHKSWLAGSRDIVMKFQVTEKDRLLIVTPCFHIPFIWWNTAIYYTGGMFVVLKEPSPELILRTIQEEKINMFMHFVPATLLRILNFANLADYDHSTVKYYIYGGAPMPVPILKRAISALGNKFMQLYGFTEQAGAVTALPPEDHLIDGTEKEMKRLSSCGKEMPSNDIRIVNKEGNPAKFGEEGELIARGVNLMKGYWKEPQETANVLKNGWFHTGDTGFIDEDKYIYITGRKKDIIISGGENITPKQIEDVIHEHPAVEVVAVIGVPDPVWVEAVKAIVVLKKGERATENEIIDFCKARLAHYKAPKSVDFVDILPTTPTGKIKKNELREKYQKK